jgi:hypothetical protein
VAKKRDFGFEADPHMAGLMAAARMMSKNPVGKRVKPSSRLASVMLVGMAVAVQHPDTAKRVLNYLDHPAYHGARESLGDLADELVEILDATHELVTTLEGGMPSDPDSPEGITH